MIITCEKCASQFNMDEKLIKEGRAKVRCSICRHIFTVIPPEPESLEIFSDEDDYAFETEETIDLDSDSESMNTSEPAISDEEEDDQYSMDFKDILDEDSHDEEIHETEKPGASTEQEKKGGLKLPIIIAGIVIIILLAFFAVFYFAPGVFPGFLAGSKPESGRVMIDTGNQRLDFGELTGRFLDADSLGKLFIIEGEIINDYPESRSHILIKATIEDSNRVPIRHKLAYAGNIYPDRQIRQMTIEEIDRGLNNRDGINNANVNVKPGASVPFMAIFENLPDNLGEFEIEAVSSSPAE